MNKTTRITAAVLSLNLLYLPLSFAKTTYPSGWFLGAEAGVVFPHLKSSTTVPNGSEVGSPYNMDLYTIKNPNTTQNFALDFGYRFTRKKHAFIPFYTLALRYQHVNSFKIKGMVEQYSDPEFLNYDYSLNASSNIFSFFGKADLCQYKSISPYISASVGLVENQISNYSEQAVSGVSLPRIDPAYAGTSSHNFMYSAGVGFDYRINRQCTASLGYEFANLGKLKTGKGKNDNWQSESLSLGTLKTNAILLSVSYQLSKTH